MTKIFEEIVPATADNAAEQLLLRMAGLTASAGQGGNAMVTSPPNQDDAREFIDDDLVDVARAGDVVRFIINSHDESLNALFASPDTGVAMGDLGVEVAVARLAREGISAGQCSAALRVATDILNAPALALDLLRVIQDLRLDVVDVDKAGRAYCIRGADLHILDITGACDLSRVVLQDCLIGELHLDSVTSALRGPRFESCLIGNLYGATGRNDLPPELLDAKTEISSFCNAGDVAADLRRLPLSPPERVLLVTLRKLFQQSVKGRKDTAFPRGLGDDERPYVAEVLSMVKTYGFAEPHRIGGVTVWMPNRESRADALAILQGPQVSNHPLMAAVRNL